MGYNYKTNGQLLGIGNAIFKLSSSVTNLVNPFSPQPPSDIMDMIADDENVYVCDNATGKLDVFNASTLQKTSTVNDFVIAHFIVEDPNPVNNRFTIWDRGSGYRYMDKTTRMVSAPVAGGAATNPSLSGGFEYDQVYSRNQVLAVTSSTSITLINATTFQTIQIFNDALFQHLGKVRKNPNNPDEMFIYNSGYSELIIFNMANLTYEYKTIPVDASDGAFDSNQGNNRILTCYSSRINLLNGDNFGVIQPLSLPQARIVIADPVVNRSRFYMGGQGLLYALKLG